MCNMHATCACNMGSGLAFCLLVPTSRLTRGIDNPTPQARADLDQAWDIALPIQHTKPDPSSSLLRGCSLSRRPLQNPRGKQAEHQSPERRADTKHRDISYGDQKAHQCAERRVITER